MHLRFAFVLLVASGVCGPALAQSRFFYEYSGVSGFPTINEVPVGQESTIDVEFTIAGSGPASFAVRPNGPSRVRGSSLC